MDYKKEYEQAIERAKGIYYETIVPTPTAKGTCEYIFPELRENEDEKLREQVVYAINQLHVCECTKNKLLAWLEKQGEKVDAIENFDTEFEKQVSYLIASTINKEYEYTSDFVKWTANALLNYAKHELEKQGEQKPTDNKVEPNFNDGDWVITKNGTIAQILDKQKHAFVGLDINGNDFICNYRHTSSMKHWTIQDAKDGDVLCGYSITDYPWIGIFHELNDDDTFKSYCYLQAGITGKFCPPSLVNIFNRRNVDEHNSKIMVPATKEQRDMLFQKMHEAGYEWDAEKKELKKIEQKPALNEEDEEMRKKLLFLMEEENKISSWGGCYEWLKSIMH